MDGHEEEVALKDVHALQKLMILIPPAEKSVSRVSNASFQISSIASVFKQILINLSWCFSGLAGAVRGLYMERIEN